MSLYGRVLMISSDPATLAAAADLGIECVVVDSRQNRDFGYRLVPEQFRTLFVEDPASLEQVYSAVVRAEGPKPAFDAVITGDEYAVVNAAVLAQTLGVRGLTPATALAYRDKALQKDIVAAAGLRTAAHMVIEDALNDRPVYRVGEHGGILKPIAGGGTVSTRRVADAAQAEAAQRELAKAYATRTLIYEDFNPGEEWFIDGVLSGDRVLFSEVTRYGVPCLDTVETGRPLSTLKMDPVREAEAFRSGVDFAEQCLRALGMFDGVFHMEMFAHEGTLTFGECAARRGGALVQEETLIKHGVDLARAGLLAAVGASEPIAARVDPGAVGSTYLPCAPGIVMRIPSEADVSAREGVRYAQIELPVGFHMRATDNTSYKLGAACLVADDDRQLDQRMQDLLAWLPEACTIVPDGTTTSGLRAMKLGL